MIPVSLGHGCPCVSPRVLCFDVSIPTRNSEQSCGTLSTGTSSTCTGKSTATTLSRRLVHRPTGRRLVLVVLYSFSTGTYR